MKPKIHHYQLLKIEQAHRKAEETLEFKLIKPIKTLHFNPTNQIKGDRMIALLNLEVTSSIFIILEEINKFKLYKFPESKIGGISKSQT